MHFSHSDFDNNICLLNWGNASGPVFAQWKPVAIDTPGDVYCLDYSTVRKEGQIRKVWLLWNFAQIQTGGSQSHRSRMEYDCKNERHRMTSSSTFTEKDANGSEVNQVINATPWVDIAPNTVAWRLMKLVCKDD